MADFDWFAELSSDAANELQKACLRRKFYPGEPVVHRSDDTRDLYLICSGMLFAAFGTEDGREVLFSRMGPGRVFGELSAIDGKPRSLDVYVASQGATEILVMPQAVFLNAMETQITLQRAVTRSLVAYVRDISERFSQLTTFSVKERVCALILRTALEQGRFREGAELDQMPTHAEIGNAIGANREAVSRAMSSLTRNGIIKAQRKRVTLVKPQALLSQ